MITFEGIEGSGKSTQISLLSRWLSVQGHRVRVTREPGGTTLGEAVRSILLDPTYCGMDEMAELFLYAACRAQHVVRVLLPELEEGSIVLCDRYCDATVAYQGFGRGLDLEMIGRINSIACRGLWPDLTILLDCPVVLGLRRSWQRIEQGGNFEQSRFEREEVDFHEKVRGGYLSLARKEPERIRVVDGSRPELTVQDEIRRIVTERLAVGASRAGQKTTKF